MQSLLLLPFFPGLEDLNNRFPKPFILSWIQSGHLSTSEEKGDTDYLTK